MPMPVNAHDHGYGIRTLDFGSLDDALETWIPTMRLRPRTDAYLEALVAFGRLAKTGVAATIHCHNSLNAARMVDEALEVIRAAKDVGIRLGLSCPLLDHDAWAYDGGPEQAEAVPEPGGLGGTFAPRPTLCALPRSARCGRCSGSREFQSAGRCPIWPGRPAMVLQRPA
jgi:hypothetical protein